MFSDYLRKIDDLSDKVLFLVAAGLVMACQLLATVLVAGEPVQKVQTRGDSSFLRLATVASCAGSGVASNECARLNTMDRGPQQDGTYATSDLHHGAVSEAAELDIIATPGSSAGGATGYMSASFAAR